MGSPLSDEFTALSKKTENSTVCHLLSQASRISRQNLKQSYKNTYIDSDATVVSVRYVCVCICVCVYVCVCVCVLGGAGQRHEVNRDFRMRGLGIGSVV